MVRRRKSSRDFTQNHGKPGVVYALGNKTLPKYLKIGQTRNMERRLASLNADCNTSNPIRGFFVAYSRETDDCGRAELSAHQALAHCRVDAYREFFECDLETARRAIDEACEAFRNKPPKPPPIEVEKPLPSSTRGLQTGAINLQYQAQLVTQHALLMARAAEDDQARQEEWRKDRAERLRTAERISEINRMAQAKKEAASPAAKPRSEPTPTAFTVAAPAPELAQQPISFAKFLLSVWGVIAGIGFLSSIFQTQPTQPVQAAPSSPAPVDTIAGDLAGYANHYTYPQPAVDDETVLSSVHAAGLGLVFQYKTTTWGERAMARQPDPGHIRRAMTDIACNKPELRAFLARGASVTYVLERQNGEKIVHHIACASP